MSVRPFFRRAARLEYDEAVSWYESQRLGLGSEFVAEIERALAQACDMPQRFPRMLATFDVSASDNFYTPSSSESVRRNWLSSRCFTLVVIRKSGVKEHRSARARAVERKKIHKY